MTSDGYDRMVELVAENPALETEELAELATGHGLDTGNAHQWLEAAEADGDVSVTLLQPLNDGNSSGVPDVIGAGFERKPKHSDAFVRDIDVLIEQYENAFGLAVVQLGAASSIRGS